MEALPENKQQELRAQGVGHSRIQKMHVSELESLTLSLIEKQKLAILFECKGIRFWIGAASKRMKKQEAYFTTDEIRSWWKADAVPDDLLAIIPWKLKFNGMELSFNGGSAVEPEDRSTPPLPDDVRDDGGAQFE